MAEFAQLLMQMFYRFLQRVASFTLLNNNTNKLEVNYKEEEDVDELKVVSLQSRELKAAFKVTEPVASPDLPKPTPPSDPQTH